jgi:hypothetical protein
MRNVIVDILNSETASNLRPFGMLFALDALPEEIKHDENGEMYVETLDCGTSKTSNSQ